MIKHQSVFVSTVLILFDCRGYGHFWWHETCAVQALLTEFWSYKYLSWIVQTASTLLCILDWYLGMYTPSECTAANLESYTKSVVAHFVFKQVCRCSKWLQSVWRTGYTTGDPEQINYPHDHAEVKQKVKCNTPSPWNDIPEHTFTIQEEFKTQSCINTQQSHHGDAVANEYVHNDPPSSLSTIKNLTFRGPMHHDIFL